MFVRKKKSGPREYLVIVENYREGRKVKQRTIANLGRLDILRNTSKLDSVIKGLSQFSEKVGVISAFQKDESLKCWAKEWGSYLVFRRLWEQLDLAEVIKGIQAKRKVEFNLEQALFYTVLHRLTERGSDLKASKWIERVYDPGRTNLKYHHLIRAMGYAGKHKNEIEEGLFLKDRDLFSNQLDLVFFDTTSIYFEGEGPEGLAEFGNSKDHRPDRKQIIIGVVMTAEGKPICCEFWPGNMSDVKTLREVIRTLKERFSITRVILVCDRGMVSKENISLLKEEGFYYIFGVRMRRVKKVRQEILSRQGRYKTIKGNLKVKEVNLEGDRFIVCLNPEEEKRDREVREKLIIELKERIRTKPSSLISNKAYRRYLEVARGSIRLNQDKVTGESRFDGKFVLTTNTHLSAEEVALTYKNLWQVEYAFKSLKSILQNRPTYHQTPDNTRGHIFCSYLSLLLLIELKSRLEVKGGVPPWDEIIRDLRSLQAIKIQFQGKSFLIRSEFEGLAYKCFITAGVQPPPTISQM
jgi:transposase